MSAHFQVACKKSSGNLHLKTEGDFDGGSARELVNLLNAHYDGKGRVFIDTRDLRRICPAACRTLQDQLDLSGVAPERVFFKGDKGYEIAPEGCRVIVVSGEHRCRCAGNCAECRCSRDKQSNG